MNKKKDNVHKIKKQKLNYGISNFVWELFPPRLQQSYDAQPAQGIRAEIRLIKVAPTTLNGNNNK